MEDFGFANYIVGNSKPRPKKPTYGTEEGPSIVDMPEIKLQEYTPPENRSLPMPTFPTTPITPTPAPSRPELQIKPTPTFTLPTIPQDALTMPSFSLNVPKPTAPLLTVPPPTQSIVKEESVLPEKQQSPTAADKEFNQPVAAMDKAKIKGKTLELPAEWSEADVEKVTKMADKYGLSKEEMFGIIHHETAGTMSPKIKNKEEATGLIQFARSTAAELLLVKQQQEAVAKARADAKAQSLSKEAEEAIVTAVRKQYPLWGQLKTAKDKEAASQQAQKAVANMTIGQQLDLADMFLQRRSKGAKGLENIYSSIFAGGPNETLIKAGTDAYQKNRFLDKDGKGGITREEWFAPVKDKAGKIGSVEITKPKANTASYDMTNTVPVVSDETRETLYDEAVNIASLANPQIKRSEIIATRGSVPLIIAAPGTPEQAALKGTGRGGTDAAGLYYGSPGVPGTEKILTTASIPRDAALGVVAHELGHALNKEESEIPGDLQYYKSAQAFVDAPNPKREVMASAIREGGRTLNQEREQLMSWAPWLPYALVQRLISRPSDAFDLNRMEEASGKGKSKTWKD